MKQGSKSSFPSSPRVRESDEIPLAKVSVAQGCALSVEEGWTDEGTNNGIGCAAIGFCITKVVQMVHANRRDRIKSPKAHPKRDCIAHTLVAFWVF
jgi:hypothetical protein